MRLNRSNLVAAPVAARSGVALVITVVLLSVITFLTVAFLALMGREKGSVKTAVDQSTARLAADAALERAKAELVARLLSTSNLASSDLIVSTNFINWNGFNPGAQNTVNPETNVNFQTDVVGNPLNAQQTLQNLTNLFYNPRVPVFITNRFAANSADFRYYLDLNRNRRHDLSGLWPVLSGLGNPYYNTNGEPIPNIIFGNTLSNLMVGDPEWIGGLDRADRPHAPDNKFLYRYAYIAVPTGKTLDVNYIHNQALAVGNMDPNGRDFFRNQGVGSWEINLAAFLYDLNTNDFYGWGTAYDYNPVTGVPTVGNAFNDAGAIYRYRVNGNPNTFGYNLGLADTILPANPFANNLVDDYANGQLLTAPFTGLTTDTDNGTQPWAGADNPNHFFTTQDFFDPAKVATAGGGLKFQERLSIASTNISTYDQYTYYRLLSQLGTDSAPEDPDKLHLNYVNVGGFTPTNFLRWTETNAVQAAFPATTAARLFFTNAVDRLLKQYSEEWFRADPSNYLATFYGYIGYTNVNEIGLTNRPFFGMTNEVPAFGVRDIPVQIAGFNQVYSPDPTIRTGGRLFVYGPPVHRVLQVAANIWDAQADRRDKDGNLPTVFRPRFNAVDGNIFIYDFVEVTTGNQMPLALNRPIIELGATNNPTQAIGDGDVLVYGAPPVIGARKYLPNFNEFAMESTFALTRKLQLRKNSSGAVIQTNQFFTMQLIMPTAAEFWNAYATNYTRPVDIYITNRTTLTLTNDLGVLFTNTYVTGDFISKGPWPAATTRTYGNADNPASFVVALRTNVPFLPLVGYLPDRADNAGFVSATNASLFDVSQAFLMPRWGMTITNRVHAMILDRVSRQIIDYVVLGDLTAYRNLTEEFSNPTTGTGDAFNLLWATNTLVSGRLSGRIGVQQQVNISRGAQGGVDLSSGRWRSFGNFTPSTAENESVKFNRFLSTGNTTNLVAVAPFSPSIVISVPMLWQANDPLVHHLSGELLYLAKSGQQIRTEPPVLVISTNSLVNIGKKNDRYKPWGKSLEDLQKDPDAFNASIKDPLVRSAEDWQFPTNVLPTVGWLGRIHRGTPWQTIYLKASNVGLTNIVNSPGEWVNNAVYRKSAQKWAEWTGNKTYVEGFYTRPVTDRVLFDVFTTALNDNAARGRLPINQTGLAAWSAVLSGMVALTNASSESALLNGAAPTFNPLIIPPAGVYDALATNAWPAVVRIVDGINRTRANRNYFPNSSFDHLGDILAVPELTDASPFLNHASAQAKIRGMTDAAYEWLPQQALSLLQLGQPRYVIYAYGQSLQPAPDSIVTDGGGFFGLCTNYAITAEVATRAVVRVEGSPNPRDGNHPNPKKRYPPRVVVESFNFLPPE